jgi:hypothetical protein
MNLKKAKLLVAKLAGIGTRYLMSNLSVLTV